MVILMTLKLYNVLLKKTQINKKLLFEILFKTLKNKSFFVIYVIDLIVLIYNVVFLTVATMSPSNPRHPT